MCCALLPVEDVSLAITSNAGVSFRGEYMKKSFKRIFVSNLLDLNVDL